MSKALVNMEQVLKNGYRILDQASRIANKSTVQQDTVDNLKETLFALQQKKDEVHTAWKYGRAAGGSPKEPGSLTVGDCQDRIPRFTNFRIAALPNS